MRSSLSLVMLVVTPALVMAEPLVVGFERFHQQTPSADGGRLLFNELGCANCHGGAPAMPERRGPTLAGISKRANMQWVRDYLTTPSKMKAGTTMPHFFAETSADDIEAVLHYLASLPPPTTIRPKTAKYLNAERGSDVYHTMGCVTCHAPGKDFQPPAGAPAAKDFTHRSVALPDMASKYSLSSLTAFLTDPLKVRVDGRMPHIEMHESDYADLAAYLLDFQHSDGTTAKGLPGFKFDPQLAEKGLAIANAMNCASCHSLAGAQKQPLKKIADISAGCMSPAPAAPLPRYEFSDGQRAALVKHLEAQSERIPAKTLADLSLQALNCAACHSRDGLGGADIARKAYFTGDHSLGDTGLVPPPLTDAGRKFHPSWLKGVLDGKNRVRPYLQTKMPVFGKATDELPRQLARADSKEEKPLPTGDAAAGQKLLGVLGGLGCITCHKWEERPSLGIQALDISNMDKRLQPGWLREYLINPAAHRVGTLMPSFWPGGVAANQTILGGDTDQQIAAIIAFTKLGEGEPEGFPATAKGEFELIPTDRPIVQRTFLESGGTHAILVGYPAGMHLAYDGLKAQPIMVWKGKFFDAYNTWFSRAAPFEKPLGDVIATWPVSAATEAVKFKGYQLDAAGVPTFLWERGAEKVEEQLLPVEGKLHRHLTWTAGEVDVSSISHPEGVTVEEAPGSTATSKSFVYSWK
jgi:cytochrome c2